MKKITISIFILFSLVAITSCLSDLTSSLGDSNSTQTSIANSVEKTVLSLTLVSPSPQYTKTQELLHPTQTSTPGTTSTPRKTPKPYLISYTRYGGDGEGSSELNSCIYWLAPHKRFILYPDGQLIYFKSGKLLETHLSDLEINKLLQDIESTGLFEIKKSKDAPDYYDIYNLPEDYNYGDGGPGSRVTVQGLSIPIRDSLWDYLIPSIEETVKIINEYEPVGNITPYIPSSLEMMVSSSEDPTFSSWTFPTTYKWPEELPPLPFFYKYFDELETENIMSTNIFKSFPDISKFLYDDIEYIVVTCPSEFIQ